MKENWTFKKVKDVCDKASSNIVLNKIEDNNGDYALYGASGFVKGVDFYHQEEPYIGIVKDGSGVGRVGAYPAKSSLVGTMQYILPKKDCSLKFLCYALQGLKLSKFVTGAAIPHIYFRDYGECVIPIPPLSEQSRIVSELDLLQSIIDKQQAQLKELDTLAQAVFYDMFGDPVENERGWKMKTLKEIASVKIGPFGSLLHTSDYIKGGVPLVNPIHMKNGRIVPDESFTISEEKRKVMQPYLLKKGDVVFARRGEIGRCAIVSEREDGYLCGTGSLFVRFKETISEMFVLYWTKSDSFVKDLVSKAKGATMLNINCNIVENLQLPIPPLPLQQAFVEKIETIEHQKAIIKQSLVETQKLFDYTMDKYFG